MGNATGGEARRGEEREEVREGKARTRRYIPRACWARLAEPFLDQLSLTYGPSICRWVNAPWTAPRDGFASGKEDKVALAPPMPAGVTRPHLLLQGPLTGRFGFDEGWPFLLDERLRSATGAGGSHGAGMAMARF
jgi:hypothetical protein